VRNHTQVLIALRNNKKLLARVKAFDRHSNMVCSLFMSVAATEFSR
jgi:small nuclear ribonucleoprotein (snRNP)-like protein